MSPIQFVTLNCDLIKFAAISGICGNPVLNESLTDLLENLDVLDAQCAQAGKNTIFE